jgi:hypothetical protein
MAFFLADAYEDDLASSLADTLASRGWSSARRWRPAGNAHKTIPPPVATLRRGPWLRPRRGAAVLHREVSPVRRAGPALAGFRALHVACPRGDFGGGEQGRLTPESSSP